MNTPRQFRLGAFIQATGHHVSAWRHLEAQIDAGLNFQHYKEITQTAKRGLFDAVFLADSPGIWDGMSSLRVMRMLLVILDWSIAPTTASGMNGRKSLWK